MLNIVIFLNGLNLPDLLYFYFIYLAFGLRCLNDIFDIK